MSPQYVAPNTINVADGSGGDFVDCGSNPIGGDRVMDTATKDAENPVQAKFRERSFHAPRWIGGRCGATSPGRG
jgi:hypothetical protein